MYCCSAADDYIYDKEMQQYEKSGVLSQLHVAFSRDGASKVRVHSLVGCLLEGLYGEVGCWDSMRRVGR